LLGVGYDMRPFRLPLPEGTRVFEVDLPTMLADRQERIRTIGTLEPKRVERIAVPLDLRVTSLADAISGGLEDNRPVFVAWEGMTMYFEEPEVRRILQGIAPVLGHPESRIWVDFVHERAVSTPELHPSVAAFMLGMQLLGEPFRFGLDSVESFVRSC